MRQVYHLENNEVELVISGLGQLGRLIGPEEKFRKVPILNSRANSQFLITPDKIDELAEALNFEDERFAGAGQVAISLSLRETALVLAGLRCYQVFHLGRDIPPSVDRFDALRSSILDIATDTGRNPEPDAAEILALIDDLSPPDPAIVREHEEPGQHDLAPGA